MTENPDLMQFKKADLIEMNKNLEAKINSLIEIHEKEKAELKRSNIIAKINSLSKEFKDDAKYSQDFLEGIAHGLSLKKDVVPDPKVNSGGLPGTNTQEADEYVNTPLGMVKKSEAKGLAVREDTARADEGEVM